MIKNLIYILIICILSSATSLAYEQFEDTEENIYGYEFKKNDANIFLKKGDFYLKQWENTKDLKQKKYYLQEAMRYYYLLSKADKTKIEAHIGLGKVYDEMELDKYAIEHFCFAYNINNKNPELNYRFGDFYLKRNALYKAHFYFNRAQKYGYKTNIERDRKISQMYAKLADNSKAKKFHTKNIRNYDKDLERANKILLLDELNQKDSQYYLFIK